MLKKCSSQEPLVQFQPNLVGNMPGGWEIQKYSNKGTCPFWGPIRGNMRTILINFEKSSHEPMAGMHRYLV